MFCSIAVLTYQKSIASNSVAYQNTAASIRIPTEQRGLSRSASAAAASTCTTSAVDRVSSQAGMNLKEEDQWSGLIIIRENRLAITRNELD